MSDFLYNLGTIVQQQYNLSDNQLHSISTQDDSGNKQRYGLLGDFANKFDQTASRTYLEQGYTKHSMLPKALEILSQQPDVTVLVKKKQFGSLSQHNRPEYADQHDKMFIRTSAILFQNKAKQLAAYERLSKIEKVAEAGNFIDNSLVSIIVQQVDAIQSGGSTLGLNIFSQKFLGVIETLRQVNAFNRISPVTAWMSDQKAINSVAFGTGTGVIEFNLVTNLQTTTSLSWKGGSCSFTLEDPYGLMKITHDDIDRAINDSLNPFYKSNIFELGQDALQDVLDRKKKLLNDIRARRGVNPIRFYEDPDTFLGNRVTILIDGLGEEIKYSAGTLQDQATQLFGNSSPTDGFDAGSLSPDGQFGRQGLTTEEAQYVQDIIAAINNIAAQNKNKASHRQKFNQENNYLRTKMALHYANKPLIQPMDSVHVWFDSKTRQDTKVSAGLTDLFTGFSFMEKFSKGISSVQDQFSTLFNPNTGVNHFEKELYVGNDFPNYLWSIMRNYFVIDKAGTHVFAGLVESAPRNYQDGHYNVNVSCRDNSQYFSMGKVNFTPSIENFNGPLYDPVTPFDISFDKLTGKSRSSSAIPQLLPENLQMLTQTTGKYQAGPLKNYPSTIANFYNQDMDQKSKNALVQNVYYSPNNFVYRWKDGIACLTAATNTGTNSILQGTLQKESIVRVAANAFAGQDVMNVLSLLIVGEPYNFSNFYKNAIQFDSYGNAGQNSPSYYRNLLNGIKKGNVMYGDFVPIKNLVYREDQLAAALSNQSSAIENSTKLDSLLQTRAGLNDQYYSLSGKIAHKGDAGQATPALQALKTQIDNLNKQINQIQSILQTQLNQPSDRNKFYDIQGDDISFDQNHFIGSGVTDGESLKDVAKSRDQLRKKLNQLTRRPLWKVKANNDTNLLIIDDTYDKDLDLQAYGKALAGQNSFSLFVNDYQYVGDMISTVAQLLDLEVFCDTQGHIRIRPPQYNRMPSSVFNRMIKKKDQLGVRVYPEFLESLYKDQVQSALDDVAILEDEIRLRGVALGKIDDSSLQDFITSSDSTFQFISNPDTGKVTDVQAMFDTKDPDQLVQSIQTVSTNIENSARSTGQVFTILDRVSILNAVDNDTTNIIAFGQSDQSATDQLKARYDKISQNLFEKTGIRPAQIQSLVPNSSKLQSTGGISELDAFRITKEIAGLIAQRQGQIKTAVSALKNVASAEIFNNDSSAQNGLTFPSLYDNSKLPSALQGMIEDESYDDYGTDSGKRFCIQNKHILQYSVTETAPEFTMVEVNGLFGEGYVPATPDLALDGGGNALTSAYAVDYDLWRQYGFRASHAFNVPFLSEPDKQCAPYAVSLLNRIRGEIFKATVSVVGNEYFQPGDVVYLEPEDLLFYVNQVNHTFTYGGQFQTSLSLTHGHNAGEYIPSPFDVIGKVLYKNRDLVNNIVIKNPVDANHLPAGVVYCVGQVTADVFISGQTNSDTVKNAVTSLFSAINPNNVGTATPTQIELRVFSNSSKGISTDSTALEAAGLIQDKITGSGIQINNSTSSALQLPKGAVAIVEVDLSDVKDTRVPSPMAWSIARDLTGKTGTGLVDSNKNIESTLVSQVIDIWIVNT